VKSHLGFSRRQNVGIQIARKESVLEQLVDCGPLSLVALSAPSDNVLCIFALLLRANVPMTTKDLREFGSADAVPRA